MARFIPTCVGNTCFMAYFIYLVPVHPHVRGEYFLSANTGKHKRGSSPRAWGILKEAKISRFDDRFIPTCVGNTQSITFAIRLSSVHPHVRGEY